MAPILLLQVNNRQKDFVHCRLLQRLQLLLHCLSSRNTSVDLELSRLVLLRAKMLLLLQLMPEIVLLLRLQQPDRQRLILHWLLLGGTKYDGAVLRNCIFF